MNKQLKEYINKRLIISLVCTFTVIGSLNSVCFAHSDYTNKVNDDLLEIKLSDEEDEDTEDINDRPVEKFDKVAYITIDDGPSKYTDQIISILNKYNAKATFFMIESNMRKYPTQVNNIIESGNTAGFHSVSHDIHKLYKTKSSAKEEFDINSETFFKITGTHTKVVRLPYGSKPYAPKESYDTLVEAGYKMWDWNLDTEDWKASCNKIVENVEIFSKNKNKVVILMHEKYQTVEALHSILEYLNNEGYVILPIDQNQEPHNFWMND